MRELLVIASVLLAIGGCSTVKLTNLKDVSPDEAIAVMRIRILYNGEDVTKGSNIILNAPAFGFPKYQYTPDDSGFIFARLPVGVSSINFIIIKSVSIQHSFPSGALSFSLNEGQAIYYVGDLTLDWQGVGSTTAFVLTAAIGAPAALLTQGIIIASVQSHEHEAQEAFRNKFPTQQDIIPALLVVKPAR